MFGLRVWVKKGHFGDQVTIDTGGITVTQGSSSNGTNVADTGNIDINNFQK